MHFSYKICILLRNNRPYVKRLILIVSINCKSKKLFKKNFHFLRILDEYIYPFLLGIRVE